MSTEEKTLHDTPLRAESEKLGATFGTFFECRLPLAYPQNGGVAREVQLARESLAVMDTNFRGFLSLSGPDRARYLNAVTTADIKNLAEGQGHIGLLLNPQGHILAEIETYALEDRLLLVSHASVFARTQETLERFIIMDDCALEDVSARFGSLAVEGPRAAAVLAGLCGVAVDALPSSPWFHAGAQLFGTPCRVVRHPFYSMAEGSTGFEMFAEPGALSTIWQGMVAAAQGHGGGPIGYSALNSLRLDAGIPWFGYDFNDRVLPHEAGVEMSHISYTKGCYTGQEIVERVRSRGHVNRRRVLLEFSAAEPIEAGVPLLAEGKEAGLVTSAAFSFLRNKFIGMGYVRREHNAPGNRLEFPGGTAEVIEFPAGSGAASKVPCG